MPLAITDARSPVGLALRSAVMPSKYATKSATVWMMPASTSSSRLKSSSSAPNSSWVSLSMRG
jgi:hypothetical protein